MASSRIIIAIAILSWLSDVRGYAIKSGCSVYVNKDLPSPQPLLLLPDGEKNGLGFKLPLDATGEIHFASGESVRLACPGDNNYLTAVGSSSREVIATCASSLKFTIKNSTYNFNQLSCRSQPYHTARKTGKGCNKGDSVEIEIGFKINMNEFYQLMEMCFDEENLTSLYSKFLLVSSIGGYQSGFPRPNFIADGFFPGVHMDNVYKRTSQRNTVGVLLGSSSLGDKYISQTDDYFLAKGHLTAKADFVFGAQHRATFHYVNVAPQWQTFNGGNWNVLEQDIRLYATNHRLNLEVYSGTHGVATLPNVNGEETQLYLHTDENNNHVIPIPKLFWKVLYDPKTQAGVAFVGVNNPYVKTLPADYLICKDISSEITWLTWNQENIKKGYSYSCQVDDLRHTVDYIPQFTVTSLLT